MKIVSSKTPEIRFDRFTDDWEQRKLKDEVKNVGTGKSSFISGVEKSDETPYAVLGSTSIISYDNKFDYSGAFVLTARVGANAGNLYRHSGDVKISDNTVYIQDSNLDFVFSLLTKYDLKRLSFGTGQPLIKASEIKNLKLIFPKDKEEQAKIGYFFKKLDETIALHQRQLENLEKSKKAFLQKMFPKNGETVPEIRFDRFVEDWIPKNISEVAPLRGGFAFESNQFQTYGIPIVRISNIDRSGMVKGKFAYYKEQERDENYLLPNKAALLAMSGATTGKVSILNKKDSQRYYQNQRVGFFQKNEKYDYGFVTTMVKSNLFMEQLKSVLVAGAQPNISSKEINSFVFLIPTSKIEQQKIGNFFKQIDKLIIQSQQEVEKLIQTKKAFLQKMFV